MKKIQRKQRPQPPKYQDNDNCWFCHGVRRHSCSGCKTLKRYVSGQKKKQKYKPVGIQDNATDF